MQRFNARGLLVALSLILALFTVQTQKLAAEPVTPLLTAEEFLSNPAHFGRNDDLGCMALAIYHEADRVKPSANEKLLIGWAVKNRLGIGFRPGNLPAAKNLCEVVWAGLPKNPQFSWTVSGEAFNIKYKREFYIAFAAAHMVYVGSPEALRLRDEVGAVDLFHADYVSPDWADNVTFAGKFGRHLFYIEEDRHEKGRQRMDADVAWQVAMLEGPLR